MAHRSLFRLSFTCYFMLLLFPAHALVIYVNANVQGGAQDGSSWANAYGDLWVALQAAVEGDEVWVAQGVYLPTSIPERRSSFVLKNGVKLYGGFSGWELSIVERNWQTQVSILSGDIGVEGDSSDNSYTILKIGVSDTTTVVDGFLFEKGFADNTTVNNGHEWNSGSALYISPGNGSAFPLIRNCRFENNYAAVYGGAVYTNTINGSVAPQFFNCTFRRNRSGLDGGAMARRGASSIEIKNDLWHCTFIENRAVRDGGAVKIWDEEKTDTLEAWQCQFIRNEALNLGGGLCYFYGRFTGAKIIVEDCLFDENSASKGAGFYYIGINYLYLDLLILRGNIFRRNTAETNAAIYVDAPSDPSVSPEVFVENCIFENNSSFGLNFIEVYSGKLKIQNCSSYAHNSASTRSFYSGFDSVSIRNCIWKNNTTSPFSVLLDITNVLEVEISNAIFDTNGDGYTLSTSSSAHVTFNNCTFAKMRLPFYITGSNEVRIFNSIFLLQEGNDEFPATGSKNHFQNCIFSVADSTILPVYYLFEGGNIFSPDIFFTEPDSGNLQLLPCSPARNAGFNSVAQSINLENDIFGNSRIMGGVIDMGAIESPAVTVFSDSITAALCAVASGSLNEGNTSLTIHNGCPPYLFTWANGSDLLSDNNNVVIQGLAVGEHTISVTDAFGERDTIIVNIGAPPLLTPMPQTMPVNCTNSIGGSAQISALGGVAPFSFQWENGSLDSMMTGLPAGAYTVTVTDANACTATAQATIETEGNFQLAINTIPIWCSGSLDGAASIMPLSGTAPFEWLWSDGQTTPAITGLGAGIYAVTVTDALGCTNDLTFTYLTPPPLVLDISATDASCFNTPDGMASVSVSGGMPAYHYAWDNMEFLPQATQLLPGWHTVTVTDAFDCTDTIGVLIGGAPIEVLYDLIHASVHGSADGAIILSQVSGGAGNYSFLWSNGASSQSIEGVLPGDYSLTVTDGEGCTQVFVFSIEAIVGITETEQGAFLIKVLPNPSSPYQNAVLSIETGILQNGHIAIFDAQGRLLFDTAFEVTGAFSQTLPHELPSGMYWVRVSSERFRKTVKWVVL